MLLGASLGRLIAAPAVAGPQPITVTSVVHPSPTVYWSIWYFSQPVNVVALNEVDENIMCLEATTQDYYAVKALQQWATNAVRFTCEAPTSDLVEWLIDGTPIVIAPADPSSYYIASGGGEMAAS